MMAIIIHSFSKLLLISSLALTVSAVAISVPKNELMARDEYPHIANTVDLQNSVTDTSTIVSTLTGVDQKAGATDDTPPGQPVPATAVTAVDGQLTPAGSLSLRRSLVSEALKARTAPLLSKRLPSDYEQVFSGTGTGPDDRDGAIQGTAYLTYTVVSNATYNVDDCLSFCSSVQGCVFANLYYEFNNELLDFVFSEHSNLKCAVYADIHTAAEKINTGGQQSIPPPAGLTYIQQSSGYSLKSLADPPPPAEYNLVFGPTNGANNAPGYMGFAFLDRYDVNACANLCNTRDTDPVGGRCQYFNIWRALVNGVPTTYTCSMYYIPADASTAVNTGQGNLQVTYSRGYQRTNYLLDGGFEKYVCTPPGTSCHTFKTPYWEADSSYSGTDDASIQYFNIFELGHSGHSFGQLGSSSGKDTNFGDILSTGGWRTSLLFGKQYVLTFFASSVRSQFGTTGPVSPFLNVNWDGYTVANLRPPLNVWTYYEVTVPAGYNYPLQSDRSDILYFEGGPEGPGKLALVLIDDITLFAL